MLAGRVSACPEVAAADTDRRQTLLAVGYDTVPSASTPADPATSPARALYTSDELMTMRVIREGSLPTALQERTPFITKRLVNQGVIPVTTVR